MAYSQGTQSRLLQCRKLFIVVVSLFLCSGCVIVQTNALTSHWEFKTHGNTWNALAVIHPFIDFLSQLILYPGWVQRCIARVYAITSSHNMNFKGIELLCHFADGTSSVELLIVRDFWPGKSPAVFSVNESTKCKKFRKRALIK